MCGLFPACLISEGFRSERGRREWHWWASHQRQPADVGCDQWHSSLEPCAPPEPDLANREKKESKGKKSPVRQSGDRTRGETVRRPVLIFIKQIVFTGALICTVRNSVTVAVIVRNAASAHARLDLTRILRASVDAVLNTVTIAVLVCLAMPPVIPVARERFRTPR